MAYTAFRTPQITPSPSAKAIPVAAGRCTGSSRAADGCRDASIGAALLCRLRPDGTDDSADRLFQPVASSKLPRGLTMTVSRQRLHPDGPELSRLVWGAWRSLA